MKIWDWVKTEATELQHVLHCTSLYLAGTALDYVSSLRFTADMEESNAFARHADGTFWLRHALITDGFNALEAILVSAGLYIGCRVLGEKYAKFAAGLPWLYAAYVHLNAAVTNFLFEIPGLYVRTVHDIIRGLLGN